MIEESGVSTKELPKEITTSFGKLERQKRTEITQLIDDWIAQQNLLKIFQAFANPEDERNPVQVIYVTHSPFLIDKNYPERVRVLEKGVNDEGTRVVNDAAKHHYEPLRSAFGAFIGETSFSTIQKSSRNPISVISYQLSVILP